VIVDFDANGDGDAAIRLEDGSANQILGNDVYTNLGTGVGVLETGTSNSNVISDSNVGASNMTLIGAATIAKGNQGYKTRNSGTADVLSGQTSATVSHGLNRTPLNGEVIVNPRFNPGSHYWVDNLTATTFRINMASAPGSNMGFNWQADVSRG